MRQYSLKSQAVYLFIGQFVGFAITTIAPIILVRMMTGKDFGLYRQILFMGSVAVILMQVSIPESLYYFFPRLKDTRRVLMTQTMTLLIMTSLAGGVIFALVTGPFGFTPPEIGRELIVPITICFFFESVAYVVELIFILEAQPRRYLAVSVISAIFRLLVLVGFYLVFRSVLGLVLGMIVLQAGRFVFLIGYLIKHYGLRIGIPDPLLLREQLRFTLPMVGSALVGLIGTQIDKGVITALMTPEQFAVYSVSSLGIVMTITMVSTAMGSVCLPRISELGGRSDLAGIRELWHKMVKLNGLLLLPTVCFCMTFAEDIISVLYTKAYVSGGNVFRVNLLILIMMMCEFGRVPQAMGRTRAVFFSNLARALVALGLALTLIPRLGLVGGAAGSVAAYWVSGALQLHVTRKVLGLTVRELLPWGRLSAILAISITAAVALWQIPRGSLSSLTILSLASTGYIAMVFAAFVALGFVNVRSFKFEF